MEYALGRVVVERELIQARVRELGRMIRNDYEGRDLVLIGVLKGAVVFLADLMREIDMKLTVDFMIVSSYGAGTKTSGVVKIIKDTDESIEGRHVIVVEDLIDSGLTLSHLRELLNTRKPASLKICSIFEKPERRIVDVLIDYPGIPIPDEFVVGYGLDYAGKYRNLKDLCVLEHK